MRAHAVLRLRVQGRPAKLTLTLGEDLIGHGAQEVVDAATTAGEPLPWTGSLGGVGCGRDMLDDPFDIYPRRRRRLSIACGGGGCTLDLKKEEEKNERDDKKKDLRASTSDTDNVSSFQLIYPICGLYSKFGFSRQHFLSKKLRKKISELHMVPFLLMFLLQR